MVRADRFVGLGQVLVPLPHRKSHRAIVLVLTRPLTVLPQQIPGYAAFIIYKKILLPYLFRGQSPFASLQGLLGGSGGAPAGNPAAAQQQGETLSKRQAKLQARAAKGDPRVQMRKR